MKISILFCALAVTQLKTGYGRSLSSIGQFQNVVQKYEKHGFKGPFTNQKGEFTCPTSDGVFPADNQCTGDYYLCVAGDPFLQHCPGNLIFDVATSHCVMPSESSCVPGSGTTPTTSERTSTLTTVSTSTTATTTTASTRTTATTTTATTTTRKPDDVTTTSTPNTSFITSTTIKSTTTSSGGQFQCPSPNGNFPIPNTCDSEYYVCIANYPYLTKCPNGEIFDPKLNRCVPANEASCSSPFVCPIEDGFFAIPGATCSNLYYVCIAGVPFVTSCPDDLIFDPLVDECLASNQVSCV